MRHISDCMCAQCTLGEEGFEEWAIKSIREYGWFAHLITETDEQSPTGFNAHTHGMPRNLKHDDFQIVIPLPPRLLMQVLHRLASMIKEGVNFEVGKKYRLWPDESEPMHIEFAYAVESDRPVLRVILPDKQYRTAKEEMDEPYRKQWEGTTTAPVFQTN